MKKLTVSLAFAATALVSAAVGAYAASDIKLIVNGKQSSTAVEIIDGSSYVPLRSVAEMLGADVKWDGDARTITIAGKDYKPQEATTPVKSYSVNVDLASGPMKMNISKVSLDPVYKENEYSTPVKAVVFEVKVENTSSETLTWHVQFGKIVTNTKEQVQGGFHSDQVGGEFNGKVIKTGKIVFEVKELEGITSLNYITSGAVNKKYDRLSEDIKTDIVLK
ncbi:MULTISPECIES: copper amine oxidase N-terminal domain-containing protein [Paenibacillus]|uniref:copper amine oxidase N-terminal domain-containing protein n=1 Tax=Paenibacillus TaxID=44249 RepID=UPI0022B900D2|nr:copper amine oxidase N-terminal domain-containing protein [Paenibacillus caseinilyticus]MCZ8518384.1 copper amine oxidase N-terminal domain-containing protein [Paenibacillus caseinilyticus]